MNTENKIRFATKIIALFIHHKEELDYSNREALEAVVRWIEEPVSDKHILKRFLSHAQSLDW